MSELTKYQRKVLERVKASLHAQDADAIRQQDQTPRVVVALLAEIEKRDELLLELCAQVSPVTANRLRAILEGGE